MKKDNLIWWIIGGIGAFALYRYYKRKNDVKMKESELISQVVIEEQDKYPDSLLAQYNIVLPVDMVSKKVKAKGEELRAGRYALQPQRIKNPVSL